MERVQHKNGREIAIEREIEGDIARNGEEREMGRREK